MGTVEDIFLTSQGSSPMERVEEIRVVEGHGIEGDRYAEGTGFWTQYGDVCEVTLIQGEHLDEIEAEGLKIKNGEHRRNIVVRGIDLQDLRNRKFKLGEATLRYARPRPPCRHVQNMTEPGMTKALRNRGGICVDVARGGTIRAGDEIEVL